MRVPPCHLLIVSQCLHLFQIAPARHLFRNCPEQLQGTGPRLEHAGEAEGLASLPSVSRNRRMPRSGIPPAGSTCPSSGATTTFPGGCCSQSPPCLAAGHPCLSLQPFLGLHCIPSLPGGSRGPAGPGSACRPRAQLPPLFRVLRALLGLPWQKQPLGSVSQHLRE